MKRHAEIGGAGIAGLSCAIMLARRGWSIRVHERSPEIREVGAGIQLKNNAIEVLEELRIFDRLAPLGTQLEHGRIRAADGRVLQERVLTGKSRVHVFLRQSLVEVLRDAALEAGAEICTNSTAIAADPAGALVLANGRRMRGDLIVAADGSQSELRNSLDLGSQRWLPTIVNRCLIPGREITRELVSTEHWSGRCRMGIMPCGDNLSFVFRVSPEWNEAASAQAIDTEFWSSALPRLRREIELVAQQKTIRHNFVIVRCPRWRKGRVAIVGDAAHGLPPTLGQGAGLTLMNTYALAKAVETSRPVEESLQVWEAAVRFVSDWTQRWALRYDFLSRQWPETLGFVRDAIIWGFRLPALNGRMRIADQGLTLSAIQALGREPSP